MRIEVTYIDTAAESKRSRWKPRIKFPSINARPYIVQIRLPKQLRHVFFSAAVLLVLLLGLGVVYTLVMDGSSDQDMSIRAQPVAVAESAPIKPVMPAANAKEGAAIELLSSPVSIGSEATITVRTNATSKCTIVVLYNQVPSTAPGLTPQIADDFGTVNWTWPVDASVPLGTWPVKVTCTYHTQTGVVQGDLTVQK